MHPLNDQVLVEAVFDDKSAGGILLPDTAKEQGQTRKGKVLAVGNGKGQWIQRTENQVTSPEWWTDPIDCKIGDIVVFDIYSAAKVESDDPLKPWFLVP